VGGGAILAQRHGGACGGQGRGLPIGGWFDQSHVDCLEGEDNHCGSPVLP
jgi:hypothetical protein